MKLLKFYLIYLKLFLKIQFIINLDIIDKTNFLIQKDNLDEITVCTEYVVEMLFDILFKINEYKRKTLNNSNKKEKIYKNFVQKIEKISLNFPICVKLISCNNFNLQEKACISLIFILQFFPNMCVKNVNMNIKFNSSNIQDLINGLEGGNKRIYKKIINIFKWIIEYQNGAKILLKNYSSYIIQQTLYVFIE